jgi:hypothetical protein
MRSVERSKVQFGRKGATRGFTQRHATHKSNGFDAFASSPEIMRGRPRIVGFVVRPRQEGSARASEIAAASSCCLAFEAPFAALLAVTTLLRVHIAAATQVRPASDIASLMKSAAVPRNSGGEVALGLVNTGYRTNRDCDNTVRGYGDS